MPFTLAHAAAALPFRHMRVVPSALVIGTFAPDFEYFLRLAPSGGFGHSIRGAVMLTLPLALCVLWLFHTFVKIPTARLLPDAVQKRLNQQLQPFPWRGATRFIAIVGSLLLGIATHILWDSFTHPTSWLYQHWSLLRRVVYLPFVGLIPYYKAFQHGSTLVGMVMLLLWFAVWYRTSEPSTDIPEQSPTAVSKRITISLLVAIALLGSAARVVTFGDPPAHVRTLAGFIGQAVCTFVALAWLELVAYGWYESMRRPSLADTRMG